MNRICIISPGQPSMNPRAMKEANALAGAGFRVHVIATRLSAALDERDEDVFSTASWTYELVDFTDKVTWLRERGLNWVFSKVGRILSGFSKHYGFAKYAHSPFSRLLIRAAAKHEADLYLAHYPAALPAAAFAAQRHNAHFAYDAEDFHLGDLPDIPDNRYKNNLIEAIEAKHISQSAYLTAASPGIASAYADHYRVKRPTVVLNVFPLQDAPRVAKEKGKAQPGPSLYWFSQVRGKNRGLELAVDAVGLTKAKVHLYIRGTPQSGFDESLMHRARERGCLDRVHFLAPAPPSQMMKLASEYDVGLAAETGATKNHQVALSNKQFTYILAGMPTVMSDTPAHIEFAQANPEFCETFQRDNPRSLADVLDALLLDPERLAKARNSAFEIGRTKYNWEIESKKLIALATEVLR